jgi:hypothetical protein
MDSEWTLRGAKILGRDHAMAGKNCQDSYAFKTVSINGQTYQIGVVADGCSEGSSTEFAGILLPTFVVYQVCHLIQFETPILQIPVALYPSVIGFLESMCKLIPFRDGQEVVAFIKDHLLATIVGFVLGETEGIVFYAGDGLVAVNEEIETVDYGNKSPYLAYHLVPRSVLTEGASQLPRTFVSRTLGLETLQRLTITTDGFSPELLQRLWEEARPIPLGLQLWMNVINGPRNAKPQAGRFYDDATVVVAERNGG